MSQTESIKYTTPAIAEYFSSHRIRWDQFYPSEREILGGVPFKLETSVLDIGCGCGGLGLALAERFGVRDYTGIEINSAAARTGQVMNPAARIIEGDFLAMPLELFAPGGYDIVISLSCIDWNVGFNAMLPKAYACVRNGGRLILSLRLTDASTYDDQRLSYQYINYKGERNGEVANYVVLNVVELFERLRRLPATSLQAFGYWGSPSPTAVTPVTRVCFAVLCLTKGGNPGWAIDTTTLLLPPELLRLVAAKSEASQFPSNIHGLGT